ncbi:hypothetical protein D6825_02165 [Candidatus Woesearchaeota archaeon]|nr:MAG: hypothetical protein D6825_02165 [Candidatus Woesearchaeota archaeon]
MEEEHMNAGQDMQEDMNDFDEEIEETEITVWDQDDFNRGEDFLPVSVYLRVDEEDPQGVLLSIESVDTEFSVRMSRNELKMIAEKLLEEAKKL